MSREVIIRLLVKDTAVEDVSDVKLMPFDNQQDQDLFSSYVASFCMKIVEAYPTNMSVGELKKILSELVVNPVLLN